MLVFAVLPASRIAFYATVATVLPIIMLALGFQLRARTILIGGLEGIGLKTMVVALLLAVLWVAEMAWAELNALTSLADGKNEYYRFVLGGAIIGGIVLWTGTTEAVLTQLIESFKSEITKARQAEVEQADATIIGDVLRAPEVQQAIESEIERRKAEPPAEGDAGAK